MSQLSNFLKGLPVQIYKPDETILAKGQVAQKLYIPLRGIIKVYEIDQQGVERRILSVQQYEPFPSGWLANPSNPVSYNYTAYNKTKCALLDQAALQKLITQYPKALAELLAYTDRRVEYAKQRIEMLVQGKAEDKVLYFLKYIYSRMSKPSNHNGLVVFTAKMTQKEIGESLGLTRETTSRILREFAERGIVKLGPRQQLFIYEAKLLAQFQKRKS